MRQESALASRLSRRRFCALGTGAIAATAMAGARVAVSATGDARQKPFLLNYIVAAALYGEAPLAAVLGEVKNTGATAIDVWSRPHGSQREQIDHLGLEKTQALLKASGVRLAVSTRYDLRAGGLGDEIAFLHRVGGELIVTGPGKQRGTVKEQARACAESFKREAAVASGQGIKIGIENHAGTVLSTPDGIRYFAEEIDVPNLGIALAPYHLPQEPEKIASLIDDLGEKIMFFQAWEYGKGCMKKLPKEEELQQLPGRGSLDFRPILAALKRGNYRGWTEIFMHPVPRGVPIRDRNEDVTAEISRSRTYLEQCLAANESS